MQTLKNALKVDIIQLSIYEYALPIIEKYKDKEITKRLSTELQKGLEGSFYVIFNPDKYGNKSISIYNHDLKYDNAVSFDFAIPLHYGQCSRIKTWKDSIDDLINQSKARKEYIISDIKVLENEILIYNDVVIAYSKIVDNLKDSLKDFNLKYGQRKDFSDNLAISYELKKELESLSDFKLL